MAKKNLGFNVAIDLHLTAQQVERYIGDRVGSDLTAEQEDLLIEELRLDPDVLFDNGEIVIERAESRPEIT